MTKKCKLINKDKHSSSYICDGVRYNFKSCKYSSKKYPLNSNQINQILRTYNADDIEGVGVDNCSRGILQGAVVTTRDMDRFLFLFRPSGLAMEKRDGSVRDNAVFTLLHEVAHLRGIMDDKEADKFAEHEFEKGKEIIKDE